ncbi:SpoIVB peptidase [Blautia sp. AF25-12LB]|nr:SpoIVB peptidase [Blautia sp. AF25-12LB]RHR18332.1 SpoIVB peptidase [Blautia sp. AF19-34]
MNGLSHTNGEDKTKGCGGNLQEKQKKYRKFLWYALVGTLLSLFILIYETMKDHIPDEIFVYADEETDWETFFQEPLISYDETVEVSQNGSYQIRCKWLGVLPLKTIKVHTVEKQEVLVSGSPVGIYMETKGVLVIDSGEITDREGIRRTPAEHIIQSGDYICEIDGKVLTGKRQLMQLVRENQGEPMELQVIRHQETIKLEMTPVETEDGSYKLGIWVRDNIQGIGTLTYVEPNGTFGALGHGISDADTGERLEISDGDLYRADILSIRKGTAGTPGELRGVINYREENRIGTICGNSQYGIRGQMEPGKYTESMKKIPTGLKQEIQTGKAEIRCDIGDGIREYQCEILEIDSNARDTNKCFVLRITDDDLLSRTGGIVQGMSGSPVLQNGKLIGAITHVFVNDPTKGYGIFIENMME